MIETRKKSKAILFAKKAPKKWAYSFRLFATRSLLELACKILRFCQFCKSLWPENSNHDKINICFWRNLKMYISLWGKHGRQYLKTNLFQQKKSNICFRGQKHRSWTLQFRQQLLFEKLKTVSVLLKNFISLRHILNQIHSQNWEWLVRTYLTFFRLQCFWPSAKATSSWKQHSQKRKKANSCRWCS